MSCVSSELAGAVRGRSRLGAVFVNPNGVDTERFGTPEAERAGALLRERLGLADRTVVCLASTFMPFHGAEVLADAIRELEREPSIHFVFVGDGARRAAVEADLDGPARDGRVTFAGRVPFAELPAFIAAADVCVAPYVPVAAAGGFVNSPIKVLESMASGRATVASSVGLSVNRAPTQRSRSTGARSGAPVLLVSRRRRCLRAPRRFRSVAAASRPR